MDTLSEGYSGLSGSVPVHGRPRSVHPSAGCAHQQNTVPSSTSASSFWIIWQFDIEKLVRRASRESLIPAVRINGTSDLAWIAMEMSSRFPGVQFYDYTKLPKPELRISSNYHLTFSFSAGNNLLGCKRKRWRPGINVAVVFDTRKGQELPQTWQGCRVVDGDLHDLRFP